MAFFMLRIWDNVMYYQESGNSILIRKDVFTLFILSLNLLMVPGLAIGLLMGLLGLKNLKKAEVELEGER